MRIGGLPAAAMVDADHVAVALAVAGEGDGAVEGGLDRRADGCRPVDALVDAHLVQDRVHARPEGRGQHAFDRVTMPLVTVIDVGGVLLGHAGIVGVGLRLVDEAFEVRSTPCTAT